MFECEELIFDANRSIPGFRHRECFIELRAARITGLELYLRHKQRIAKLGVTSSHQGMGYGRIEFVQPRVRDVDQHAIIGLECLAYIQTSQIVRAAHETITTAGQNLPVELRARQGTFPDDVSRALPKRCMTDGLDGDWIGKTHERFES